MINPLVPRRYTIRGMYKIGQWLRSLHNDTGCGAGEDFLERIIVDTRNRIQALHTNSPVIFDIKFIECILYSLEENLSRTYNAEPNISTIHGDLTHQHRKRAVKEKHVSVSL